MYTNCNQSVYIFLFVWYNERIGEKTMKNIIDVVNGFSDLIALNPATEKQISDAENQLGLKFANEYKEYLAKFGAIMADNIELSGIAKSEHRNVVPLTQQEWGLNPTIPHNMYVVENVGIDGIIIWQDGKGEIYQSQPNIESKKIANSLAEYIINCSI